MRILHILNEVSAMGNGIENTAVDMACAQADSGHTVAVVSGGGAYVTLLESQGVKHFVLNQGSSRGSLNRGFYRNIPTLMRILLGFRRITRSFDPDIVHCHVVTGMIVARINRVGQRYRLVSHLHNVHQRSSTLMRLADKSIAVSDGVAREMARWGFRKQNVAVIRCGTLGTKRLSKSYEPINLKQPALVTVAGLSKRKNIDGVIRAFAEIAEEFPAANLYLVGEGGDREEFKQLALQTKVADRIHFEGFKPDPRPYMKAAQVFVLPSHRESFGLVFQEAREAGAAIIGTDVDGIPETLDYGRAGILVPPGNQQELVSAIRLLLSDDTIRKQWQRAAKQNLEHQTTWYMAAEIEALYRSLLPNEPEAIPSELHPSRKNLDSLDRSA